MRTVALLILLLAPALAAARWYQVDVVVFRHNVTSSPGAEQWPALSALPDYAASLDLLTDLPTTDGAPAPSSAAEPPAPVAFKALAASERGLLDVERRLRNSAAYAPLLSVAWRQPKSAVSGMKRVHLSDIDTRMAAQQGAQVDATEAALAARVEGTVLVKVARQINVDIDFTFDHDGTPVRLRGSRAVKLREVNYFDHPLFGVLVQVLPYDLPDDDPAAGSASDEPVDEGAPGGGESSTALPAPD